MNLPPHPQPQAHKSEAQISLTPGDPANLLMEVVSFLRMRGPHGEGLDTQLRQHTKHAEQVFSPAVRTH